MSIYNEDELVPPTWINQDFFEKVLRQYEKNDTIKLTDLQISPASVKGDHYASIMFRCKVSYGCNNNSGDIKQKSLILKTLPMEDGPKRDMLKESSLFETEIGMYTKALPKIEKILADGGEATKLAADIIYHSLEPNKVLIFEDLCEAGYTTIRGRYLTEDEIKLVFSKIARLHAASFILSQTEDKECVTKFEDGMLCSSNIMAMDFMTSGIVNFIAMLKKHEEFKVYLEKIEAMKSVMLTKSQELYKAYKLNRGQGDIFVLNHGDFHLRNMMFKFNSDNQMEDLIMVDYQISCYGPSTIDLAYSQYLLMSPEMRARRNIFMLYYFEEFLRVLKRLNFKGQMPLYSDFQIAFLKYRHFTLFLLSTILPHVRMILVASTDDLKDVDATKYVENPEMGAVAYEHPEFLAEMRHLLPRLLREGFFD
ncbi:uncharacterized protein LOC119611401 [Lucilia sericata]|uniref:uncharacterized protein LOC119611401 n=1 Tax=Lucilia sericata TaxID=13632 RepID=UPI0018A87F35|nr:uncharacterized protein LOC119611401 [Lucilia sericata]